MPWFKVDDGFPDHPKLEGLENNPQLLASAITVWVFMGCDSCRRLVDGSFTSRRLEKVCFALGLAAAEGANALVEAGLWERTSDGYRFRHWEEYQASKTEIEERKVLRNARQKRWRDAQRRPRDASGDDDVDRLHDASQVAARDATKDAPRSDPIQLRRREISDHTPPAPSSLSAQAPEVGGWLEQPNGHSDTADPAPEFDQHRMTVVFQREYMARRKVAPSMHTRDPLLPRKLHEQVTLTAKARGSQPEALFLAVLRPWLAALDQARQGARQFPFAFFAGAFSALVEGSEDAEKQADLKKVADELEKQLRELGVAVHNAAR